MSEVEIRYEVPDESRKKGDLETLINAMGAYQVRAPFFIKQEIQVSEDEKGTALVRLVRMTLLESALAHTFHSNAAEMRADVEEYFPDESKDRLTKLFVDDTSETPQS